MDAGFLSFAEHDLDGARAAIQENYFPTSLDVLHRRLPYEFRFAGVARGAVFQAVGSVEMRTSDHYASYAVKIDSGALEDSGRQAAGVGSG